MRHLPTRPALLVAAGLSGMAGSASLGWHSAWQLAQQRGAPLMDAPVAAARPAADARVSELMAERDAALASAAVLQERLAAAEGRRADEASELALYRRLGDRATGSGLGVESVAWRRDADRYRLDITLVQAKGKARVRGTLGVGLISDDAGGDVPRQVEIVPDAGADSRQFDLRFFQTVSVPVGQGIAGPTIRAARLAISVRPDGDRHPAFVDIRDWDTILPLPGAE